MRVLLACAVSAALAADSDKPRLAHNVFPVMQTLNIAQGCSVALITIRIQGPENERWYCPAIEWEFIDGTISTDESDCAPFEKRHECQEDQTGCGLRGFRLNPITDQYEDIVKECPCTITGYPRVWTKSVCYPEHPKGAAWKTRVRLRKNGETIAFADIENYVK